MYKNSAPTILETNIFYLLIALVFMTLGAYVQYSDLNTGLLITEFEIILIPTIFYLSFKGYNINKVLRLNKISFKQAIITPLIVIFSYPVGIFLNLIVIMILSYFGKIIPQPLPTPTSGNDFFIGFFIVSFAAGICEEVMFRGMILNSYERLGKVKAIIISGVMFGVFHFNIQNLIGPIFLGILFAYIVLKTNSIFTAIIAHSTNNAIAWILSFVMGKISFLSNNTNTDVLGDINSKEKLLSIGITLIVFGLWALISGGIAFLLLRVLPKGDSELNTKDISFNKKERSKMFKMITTYASLVIVLLIFIFINIRILMSV